MPTITKTEVQGYAHCRDSLCLGNEQEPVPAIRELIETTYKEIGGDMPGVQNSTTRFAFVDASHIACPECGADREIADQVRPVYPVMTSALNATTTDPRYLLELKKLGRIVAPGETAAGAAGAGADSARVAELEKQLAEMNGTMTGLLAALQAGGVQPLAAAAQETSEPAAKPKAPARRGAGS